MSKLNYSLNKLVTVLGSIFNGDLKCEMSLKRVRHYPVLCIFKFLLMLFLLSLMPLRSILTFRSDLTFIPDNKGENGIDSKKPNCITLRPHEQHMSGLTEIASLYTTTVYHLALLGRPLD